ncbi:hypothetical protein [Parendozoicomonas sp. Alg238-R29]|uniref:hypothetical protein n=1 Tax=Parendozoicomonas sp. Alg238-R29 TaxID=2993446 RepID=UPI00248DF432|nr:hypothetical protein [Parendozoicomonas sp. Alg238-R29]
MDCSSCQPVQQQTLKPTSCKNHRATPYNLRSACHFRSKKVCQLDSCEKEVLKISQDLFVSRESDNLHLVMQRVTTQNIEQWKNIAKKQELIRKNLYYMRKHKRRKGSYYFQDEGVKLVIPPSFHYGIDFLIELKDSITVFENTLSSFKESSELGEHWIAYACKTGAINSDHLSRSKDIEMLVSVRSPAQAPLQINAGISRLPEYLCKHPTHRHPHLSLKLHGFSARVMQKYIKPENKYLVSVPLPKMFEIMKRSLPSSAFQKGHNFPGSFIDLESPRSSGNPKGYFKVKDHEGKTLFECDEQEMIKTHDWWCELLIDQKRYLVAAKIDAVSALS